jgi:hypothetical protein
MVTKDQWINVHINAVWSESWSPGQTVLDPSSQPSRSRKMRLSDSQIRNNRRCGEQMPKKTIRPRRDRMSTKLDLFHSQSYRVIALRIKDYRIYRIQLLPAIISRTGRLMNANRSEILHDVYKTHTHTHTRKEK